METATLDPLARFHRTLVEEIARTRPIYLSEPFTVAEIYQNLVPYRTHRDRIGVQMNGDYEDVLLRLLAGEGEYLVLESVHAKREIEQELRSSNPNTGLYREYAAVDVRLNQTRMPTDLPEPVSMPDSAPANGAPTAVTGQADSAAPTPPSGIVVSEPEVELPPVAADGEGLATESSGGDATSPSRCLWCREPLPNCDTLNYCPFCGADLHKAPCPNCGEELEMGWRFCVACGTAVDEQQ